MTRISLASIRNPIYKQTLFSHKTSSSTSLSSFVTFSWEIHRYRVFSGVSASISEIITNNYRLFLDCNTKRHRTYSERLFTGTGYINSTICIYFRTLPKNPNTKSNIHSKHVSMKVMKTISERLMFLRISVDVCDCVSLCNGCKCSVVPYVFMSFSIFTQRVKTIYLLP